MNFNEPWMIDIKRNWADILNGKCELIDEDLEIETARRIISCVNTLAGIENPAEYIKNLESVSSEQTNLFRLQAQSLSDRNKKLVEALKKVNGIQKKVCSVLSDGGCLSPEISNILSYLVPQALAENEKEGK
jgi:hypothetical protein